MYRLVICDDQPSVRNGLQLILGVEPDFHLVGLAPDGPTAIALTRQHAPDLVLMDLKMPGMSGVAATRELCRQCPATKVLVLTTYDQDPWVMDALRAGASGYLLKDAPRATLVAAIRGTIAGQTYLDPAVAGTLLTELVRPASPAVAVPLSRRDRLLLHHLVAGLSNMQIAERLHLSEGTIRNYLTALFIKLEVTDRTQAAVWALQHGIALATDADEAPDAR